MILAGWVSISAEKKPRLRTPAPLSPDLTMRYLLEYLVGSGVKTERNFGTGPGRPRIQQVLSPDHRQEQPAFGLRECAPVIWGQAICERYSLQAGSLTKEHGPESHSPAGPVFNCEYENQRDGAWLL